MFLAETIWQQQEGTLMSIEGTLSSIVTVLTILLILAFIIGLSMELKLSKANRIARATHDLLKAILEEQKKAKEAIPPPPPAPLPPKAEETVYKI